MLDPRLLREDPAFIKKALSTRGQDVQIVDDYVVADLEWRELSKTVDDLKNQRNQSSKVKPSPEVILEMKALSAKIKELDEELKVKEEKTRGLHLLIPNIPAEDTPIGSSEADNKVIRTWGKVPEFSFKPKEHDEIGTTLDILDFPRGAKLSGARFVVYKGSGARLERALINFMLDVQTKQHGYLEIMPPLLVNSDSMTGTGQLPKFAADLFSCKTGDYWLIPTAEVPLTNLHRDEILKAEQLPIKYTAYTPCFRSEAGSYGKDTKGIIRQHQFNKVEIVKFSLPENSDEELESLTNNAEKILQLLELPYRVVQLCSADIGFSSAKTYDLEVWLPSQNCYREISSCSNFKDFQARRAGIRFRRTAESKPEFVHTLNGSGLAVGRTFAAILENCQTAEGKVKIPKALIEYMGGVQEI
ncbi:MAG: serine--tRNA ligase [Candidatus Margulisiibacteriota bacterium]|jgi:seryl-tRNA synthetase